MFWVPRPLLGRMLLLLALGLGGWFAPKASAQDVAPKDGLFITVLDPITDVSINTIKAKIKKAIERQNRKIQIVVFDFNPFEQPAGTSNFIACNELAEYIRNLTLGQVHPSYPRMHTVAFIHKEVSKHTVLPVLACGERVMSNQVKPKSNEYLAKLGDVLRGQEVLSTAAKSAYEAIAETYPSKDLILRMTDRNLILKKVTTPEGVRYVDEKRLPKLLADDKNIKVDPDGPAGLEAGKVMFDPETALKYGLCKALYNSRADLAAALKLPRQALSEDWIVDAPRPTLFDVRGLDKGNLESLERRIRTAVGHGSNFIVLKIDAQGGDTRHVPALAQWLRDLKDNNNIPVKTVAYVPPGRTLGAATFLALRCNDIVMAKDAALGDFSYLLQEKETKAEDLQRLRSMLVPLAKEQGYPPRLFEATLDPDMVLYRVKDRADPSDERLVTEQELDKDKQAAQPRWHSMGRLSRPEGKLLKISADLAREWRVAPYADVETLPAL